MIEILKRLKSEGMTVVISGTFELHSRDEYKAMIEVHGGKNGGGVTSKTSLLLAGANMGPAKLEKAQKLGIQIMSEDEFLSVRYIKEEKLRPTGLTDLIGRA